MHRQSLLLIILLCLNNLSAQNTFPDNIHHWVTQSWKTLTGVADIDTTYISSFSTHWNIKGRMNLSGASLSVSGYDGVRHFNCNLSSYRKITYSIGAGYRGLSVNLSLNPEALAGKYNDYEWTFSTYYNRFGFEAVYHKSSSFSGNASIEDSIIFNLPVGIVSQEIFNFNTYYAFNYRRFSHPAAFSQSFLQQRSCGSLLAGLSYQWRTVHVNDNLQPQTIPFSLFSQEISLGAGYGYNYVPFKGLMLHISTVPSFIIYSERHYHLNGAHAVPFRFPEVIITARGALVYNIGQWFMGSNMVFNFSTIGDRREIEIHNIKWQSHIFIGVRL